MRQIKTKVMSVPKRWLSSSEAQAYLGMGPDFFNRLRKSAKIHFYLVGKSYFYDIDDIDKLITSNKVI